MMSGTALETCTGHLEVTIEGLGTMNVMALGEPLYFLLYQVELTLKLQQGLIDSLAARMHVLSLQEAAKWELVSFDRARRKLVVRRAGQQPASDNSTEQPPFEINF